MKWQSLKKGRMIKLNNTSFYVIIKAVTNENKTTTHQKFFHHRTHRSR